MADDPHRPVKWEDHPTLAERQTVIPVARTTRKHSLWARDASGKSVRHELPTERTTIGRGDDATIRLSSTAISRQHAALTYHTGEYTITDLNSLHGVLLNGIQVNTADLRDGDVIQLADILLVYEEG